MNCRRAASLLSAYIDGELNGIEMLAVREHIKNCTACSEDYESLRTNKQMIARLQTVAPRGDLAKAICSRLDAIEMPAYVRLWADVSSGLRVKLTPAFATVAAVSIAFLLLGARGRTPHSYDLAMTWQQLPKPVSLSLTDLPRSDLDLPTPSVPPFWKSERDASAPEPIIVLAGLAR